MSDGGAFGFGGHGFGGHGVAAQAATAGTVTILAGSSFVLCTPDGEVRPGGTQGYFAGDTRLIDELAVQVCGQTPHLLAWQLDDQTLTSRATVGDPTQPDLLVTRATRLTDRLVVTLLLHNLTSGPLVATVELTAASDFADLFDVKRGLSARAGFVGSGPLDGALVLAYDSNGFQRSVRVECSQPAEVLRDGLHVEVDLGPRGLASLRFDFEPNAQDTGQSSNQLEAADPRVWEAGLPVLQTSSVSLDATWQRCAADLGTLLLADPEQGRGPIVAAGSPWFMALFGRDSLITSWSALPLDASLSVGTLRALARRQGRRHVEASEEQPGRILHELRAGEVVLRPGGWGAVYYGSVDATPLFVMTLAEAWRWGADTDDVVALLPAAEAAVGWVLGDGDPDGDGLVEYGSTRAAGTTSLKNQGWKDSDDAIRHPDGSLATPPIALVEVQAYCWAALHAMADLREAFATGDPAPLRHRASELAEALDERFWMDDEDCYAMALDGAKAPVRSVASNAGHVLWAGANRPERAVPLAQRLMAGDLFTGWGLRTLSSVNPGYNPLSYHCGSVWPHDSALVAAGMMRAGADEQARELTAGLLDAASAFGGRPPELFGGFPRSSFDGPIPYPTSCSPQAWAAASPALLVRAMLGLDPDLPAGVVHLRPSLPTGLELELRNLRLGDSLLGLRAVGDCLEASVVDGDVQVVTD